MMKLGQQDCMTEFYSFIGNNGKSGFRDAGGVIRIPARFDRVGVFTEGLCAIVLEGKLGYVDSTGELVIPAAFNLPNPHDFMPRFNGGLAPAGTEAGWGFLDPSGRFVIEPKFDVCRPFSEEDLAPVRVTPLIRDPGSRQLTGGIWGFVDRRGRITIPAKFTDAWGFHQGKSVVGIQGYGGPGSKFGFINVKGNLSPTQLFDMVSPFQEDVASVLTNGKCGFVNYSGEFVIEPKFDFAGQFWEGLAPFRIGGPHPGSKWGFIDKHGNIAIKPEFDHAVGFSEGLAGVQIGKKWGFVRKNGSVAIKPAFDRIHWQFRNGRAVVLVGSKTILIDQNGNHLDQ